MQADPTVILTRPAAESARFAELIQHHRPLAVIIAPAFEITNLFTITDLSKYAGVVFSSQNAVNSVPKKISLDGIRVFAVGDRTGEVAARRGADVVSASGDAERLIQLILKESPKGKLLHIRGEHTRGQIADRLNRAGIGTESVVSYTQKPIELTVSAKETLGEDRRVILPLFSPRTAQLISNSLEKMTVRARIEIIAMSESVADSWTGPDPAVLIVAKSPTAAEMLNETLRRIG